MNRQQIDALVKQMNVDTAKGEVDARVQQIVVRLLGDLFQAIEDLDIQPSGSLERFGIFYRCRSSK